MGRQMDVLEAALERDVAPVKPAQPRHFVDVFDVEGNHLRDIAVPFGLRDPLRFAVLMLNTHHPDVRILDARPHTPETNAAVLVADRGPL